MSLSADGSNVCVSGPGDSVLIPLVALLTTQDETGPARDTVRYAATSVAQEQEEDDDGTTDAPQAGA